VGCAVHTTLPAGAGYPTVKLEGNYLRTIICVIHHAAGRPMAGID
jgi:acyl-coenzyme A thioesterase PaaI-like protein